MGGSNSMNKGKNMDASNSKGQQQIGNTCNSMGASNSMNKGMNSLKRTSCQASGSQIKFGFFN
jgi:hypothetical protein